MIIRRSENKKIIRLEDSDYLRWKKPEHDKSSVIEIYDHEITVVVMIGLPGSGKSTIAKRIVSDPENQKSWVRINRDDLRDMSGAYWVPDREQHITNMEDMAMQSAMSLGYNIVLDATNFKDPTQRIMNAAIKATASISIIKIHKLFVDEPVDVCIEADSRRVRPVGKKVIQDMAEKYHHVVNELRYGS